MDQRGDLLLDWLTEDLAKTVQRVEPLAGDASFRRYFRVCFDGGQAIAMDAPPEKECCDAFVAISKTFGQMGLCVPEILAEHRGHGFLLISDLGDDLYLNCLTNDNADELYKRAIDALLQIQSCERVVDYDLPAYDHALMWRECQLFQTWFLQEYLQLTIDESVRDLLTRCFDMLIADMLQQPQLCVHRDYHCRNLLKVNGTVGVIDYQDAVIGPISYDLVSLLKDCYIDWPQERIDAWLEYYVQGAKKAFGFDFSTEQFSRWFHWTGIQRHLKAIGIFARLDKLYGKPGYIADIPRTMNYVVQALARFPELNDFSDYLQQQVLPAMAEHEEMVQS